MSHYTVGIITPSDELDDFGSFVEQQLAPFDEDIKVAPYVCYSLERAKHDLEREVRHFTRIIADRNEAFDLKRCQKSLDELLLMTPDHRRAEDQAHQNWRTLLHLLPLCPLQQTRPSPRPHSRS